MCKKEHVEGTIRMLQSKEWVKNLIEKGVTSNPHGTNGEYLSEKDFLKLVDLTKKKIKVSYSYDVGEWSIFISETIGGTYECEFLWVTPAYKVMSHE